MIDIQNLSYRYAGSKELVFDGFSLQLSENNIYGLLGKNGTGKSTLLYLLAGLLRPTQGSVAVDGMESGKRLPAMTLDKYVSIMKPFYPRFSSEVLRSCLEDFELPTSLHLNALSMGQ